MIDDPIVREIRRIRHEIEHECNNDGETYYKYLISLQQKFRERLVRRKPKSLPVRKQ